MKVGSARGRTSLLRRILHSNLLVAGAAVVSLTILFLSGYRAEFKRQEELRARMVAGYVARQTEVAALVGDREAIEKIAIQAATGEDVLSVRVEYRGGQDVLATGVPLDKTTKTLNLTGNSWIEAFEDIRPVRSGLLDWDDTASKKPESIGRVRLRISLQHEETLFLRTVLQSIVVAGALLILIVSIQSLRMRKLFRPLEELIAFTRQVGAGELLERTRVDQVDEIADVAVAFNQMLDRLSGTTVSRDYVDNIISSMAECLIVLSSEGTIRTVNEATLNLLDYSEDELVGKHVSTITEDNLSLSPETISAKERLWRTRDGRTIPVLFSSAALRQRDSREGGIVWLAQDTTDQKRVREELIAARERYALAVAGANDGIWDWNVLTGEVYYSPRWKSMLGYEDSDLPGSVAAWINLLHPDDRTRVEHTMEAHRIGASAMFESEHRMRHRDGTYRWILNRGLAVRGPDGTATRIAGSQTDITYNKVSDPLTGLPNRVYFTDKLIRAFERRRRDPDHRFAVLFLDLDRFKMINDSLGHLAGDQLLILISERLRNGVQARSSAAECTVARLSGDEFAVLLEGVGQEDAAAAAYSVGSQLIHDFSLPFILDGREIFSGVSIGVASDTGSYSNPSEILRDADIAMYRAKAAGKSRCEIFDSAMRAQAVSRLELDTDLRKAVDRNEFVVYYQPKFLMPDERLQGFEALVRWVHPTRGLLPPAEFIPIAEETGLILPVGSLVLREACRQMHHWQVTYPHFSDGIVSVNISPRQFMLPDLAGMIAAVLNETGLKASSLSLELTESVLIGDTEKVLGTLTQLRALGIGLQIDDFGTGYSSLSYLHRFPFDTVKIDRSFIANIDCSEGAAIVKTIITLAENLGMKVIAEGVETRRQMALLRLLGCHDGQGYWFSRPVPASLAEVIIGSSREPATREWGALSEIATHEQRIFATTVAG